MRLSEGRHRKRVPVGERGDGAIAIGSQQADAGLGIARDGAFGGMAEGICFARGNDRKSGSDGGYEIWSG